MVFLFQNPIHWMIRFSYKIPLATNQGCPSGFASRSSRSPLYSPGANVSIFVSKHPYAREDTGEILANKKIRCGTHFIIAARRAPNRP